MPGASQEAAVREPGERLFLAEVVMSANSVAPDDAFQMAQELPIIKP